MWGLFRGSFWLISCLQIWGQCSAAGCGGGFKSWSSQLFSPPYFFSCPSSIITKHHVDVRVAQRVLLADFVFADSGTVFSCWLRWWFQKFLYLTVLFSPGMELKVCNWKYKERTAISKVIFRNHISHVPPVISCMPTAYWIKSNIFTGLFCPTKSIRGNSYLHVGKKVRFVRFGQACEDDCNMMTFWWVLAPNSWMYHYISAGDMGDLDYLDAVYVHLVS